MTYNSIPITRLAHSLTDAMGVEPPHQAEEPIPMIETLVKTYCVSSKAEKMLIFCPDAIGQWLIQKYTMDFAPVLRHTQLQIPLCAAFPPVTPSSPVPSRMFTGSVYMKKSFWIRMQSIRFLTHSPAPGKRSR